VASRTAEVRTIASISIEGEPRGRGGTGQDTGRVRCSGPADRKTPFWTPRRGISSRFLNSGRLAGSGSTPFSPPGFPGRRGREPVGKWRASCQKSR